jgi:hypothetical protein
MSRLKTQHCGLPKPTVNIKNAAYGLHKDYWYSIRHMGAPSIHIFMNPVLTGPLPDRIFRQAIR